VKHLDFSADSFYLTCEEIQGDFLFYEIETRTVLYSDTVDFEIEFMKDGLRTDKMMKSVHNFYN